MTTLLSLEPDNHFAPNEYLYLRLNPKGIPAELTSKEHLLLNEVKFPDFSVNRGKYSSPEDVIKPCWPNHGIARFLVQDIPGPIQHEVSIYTFKPHYLPEIENIAHSEIWSYKNGTRDFNPKNPLPKIAKAEFRAVLRDKLDIVRFPMHTVD